LKSVSIRIKIWEIF